jgi:serine protease
MSSGLLVLCRLLAVAAALAAASAEAGALRLRQQREKADKHYVVHVKNAQGKADVDEIAHRAQEVTSDYLGATLDRDAVALLEADGNIWSLEEDTPWEELGFRDEPATPEEEYYHRQLSEQVGHGIFDVQADQVEAGPANITVCVVDTGFAAGHPDLEGSSTTGVNRTSSEDGSIMPWNQDVRGHGTIVSGILAARISNDLGIRGIGDIPLFISRYAVLGESWSLFEKDRIRSPSVILLASFLLSGL